MDDFNDRDKELLNIIKTIDGIEHKFKGVEKATSNSSRVMWLHEHLPNLEDFSDFQMSSSMFKPLVRRMLLLDDNETIFLLFSCSLANFPDAEKLYPSTYLLFTNEKVVIVNGIGTALIDYYYTLSSFSFEPEEKRTIENKIEKFLKDFDKKAVVYPLDYKAIYNIGCRKIDPHSYEIEFSRKDRLASLEYRLRIHDFGDWPRDRNEIRFSRKFLSKKLSEEIYSVPWRPTFPSKPSVGKRLIDEGYACKDSSGNLYYPPIILCKVFIDAVRLIPKERQKIMNILSAMRKKGEEYVTQLTITKERFSSLRCENCGAGQFGESLTTLKTPEGTYSLLKCKYCGFEGTILKEAKTYKLVLPKES